MDIITKMASPQDFGSRHNTDVDTIVLHTTEGGSVAGAIEHWARKDVVGSAHYVIDGKQIVQCVAEGDAAYHAGNLLMNRRSIGIEVVGHCGDPKMWTPHVLAQLVRLSADVMRRHRVPLLHQPGPGVCGHRDVPDPKNPNLKGGLHHHTDPGVYFPWDQYLANLRALLGTT